LTENDFPLVLGSSVIYSFVAC